MRAVELIVKKRDGRELNKDEIDFLVSSYVSGKITDYQMSAFLMAVVLNGMTDIETSLLTDAYIRSGATIDLRKVKGSVVDKHSTGGVGDKVSIALSPIVTACGVKVCKMSGRGLGFTGGTIDKLESIKGFSTELSIDRMVKQVNGIGIAIAGQSEALVPADKKIYALRDVTGTVDSIPLIAASIMSKKLASGAHAILLDVKVGNGAFMKDQSQGERLAKLMIAIGKHLGRQVWAHLTDMSQPLGRTIGNANEIVEAVKAVKGEFIADDFKKIIYESASDLLLMAKKARTKKESLAMVERAIASGAAYGKLKEWVVAQGGSTRQIDDLDLLWTPRHRLDVRAGKAGWVEITSALGLGLLSVGLGAGRQVKGEKIDHQAGIYLHKVTGEQVKKGEVIATLYADKPLSADFAREYNQSVAIRKDRPAPRRLVLKRMTSL